MWNTLTPLQLRFHRIRSDADLDDPGVPLEVAEPEIGGLPRVAAQGYELEVAPDGQPASVELTAASAAGLRHGIAALAQLLHAWATGSDGGTRDLKATGLLPLVRVVDR